MGFGQHGGGNYVKVSCGKLRKREDDREVEYDWYEGRLLGINLFDDSYEGQPVPKVELRMVDELGEEVRIQFGRETWYSVSFFSRVGKIDPQEPFRLGVMGSDQNDKISFCWMRQGDEKVVRDEDAPKPERVNLGKRTVLDYEGFNAFVEKMVAEVNAKIGHEAVAGSDAPPPDREEPGSFYDDDLPF